jgi:hypothetical protein
VRRLGVVAGAVVLLSCADHAPESVATSTPRPNEGEVLPGLIGALIGTPADRHRDVVEVAERTTACMTELGWEYVFWAPEDTNPLDLGKDTIGFRRTYGYGISVFVADPSVLESVPDPNRQARDRMRGDRALRYDNDLASCQSTAAAEVYGRRGAALQIVEVYYDDEVLARVRADPLGQELEANWRACMKESGHEFEDRAAIRAHLEAEVRAVLGREGPVHYESDGALTLSISHDSSGTDERLTDEQIASIGAIVQREHAIADADLACMSRDEARAASLRAMYEQQFVENHPELAGY